MRKQTMLGEELTASSSSLWKKYCRLIIGKETPGALLKYEIINLLFVPLPGVVGLVIRKLTYPWLIGKMGTGVVIGKNVIFRHPHKIKLGNHVVIDDNCVLDAKGRENGGITVGDQVVISRNTVLSCKGGSIEIGNNSNIGSNCLIHSESRVSIGENVLVAAYCYLVAGGNHDFSRVDIPVIQQPSLSRGGIVIADNVWLGARVTILDGAKIERDVIVGAGAVVNRSLPPFAIAVGIPAKVIRRRVE